MVGKLLMRGLLVGLLAGIVAFGIAYLFGEPPLSEAILFEEQMAALEVPDPHAVEEEAPVSRTTQATTGLLTGTVILSMGLGGMFAIVFAFAHGRLGHLGVPQSSALLAALCFVTVSLVPWLKYPANPPASTFDDTVAYRTQLYFLMLALSIAASAGSLMLRRKLLPQHGAWRASVIAVICYLVAVGLVLGAMPAVNETPEAFPADVFWDFRIASLGIMFVIWAVIGLAFGIAAERLFPGRPAARGGILTA
ncbi:CbtA family protein [Paracoccus marinaquae]|uniref:CbtA family protein n=1 Tax=Paracoccus marinaquae TaxID=2841926 RepID=A0ABS6AQI3_9RHOB|nr:CbtA family protein [Paracoccus marinaquae]MBU3031885.1 CbtA family protein [Paracoccus marinaquae]